MTYRPARRRTQLATALGVLSAAIGFVGAITTAMQLGLVDSLRNGEAFGIGELERVDSRQRWIGIVDIVIGVPWAVAFFVWVYRANCNARALGAGWMKYSPGWSVGWFFVPVAGLFMPYLALREIWRASFPGPGGQPHRPASWILRSWWACSVLTSVNQFSRWRCLTGQGEMAVLTEWPYSEAGRVTDAGALWLRHLLQWSWGLLAGDVCGLVTVVLATAVVITIYRLQEQKHAEMPNIASDTVTAITATRPYP